MTKRMSLSAVLTVLVFMGMRVAPLTAQGNLEYPEPRYPYLKNVETAEDLLDIARAVGVWQVTFVVLTLGLFLGWMILSSRPRLAGPDGS